jgi:hypothetical protein
MKGLELSEQYFTLYGAPMIEAKFSDYKDRIAAGLVGGRAYPAFLTLFLLFLLIKLFYSFFHSVSFDQTFLFLFP